MKNPALNDSQTTIEVVRRLCERFHVHTLLPQIDAYLDTLQNSGVVDVAVLGQFKAGKSSFLNSVIGRNLMPVDVLPATAVVTRISYGAVDRVVVHGLSGDSEEIPVDRLADYVTEKGNPQNEKHVAWVEVETASLELYRGIRFVDTPGLGSLFTHNTEASLNWLPRVGCALVAVSMNQPIGAQDLQLLGNVLKHTPEVVLLLTKADFVSEPQRASVIEFTQWQLSKHLGREFPVLPFSTHEGYQPLRDDVRDYLLRRIVSRHEELFAKIAHHKMQALVSGLREYLLLAERAALVANEARSELQNVLQREKGDMGALKNEIRLLVGDVKFRARTASVQRFLSYQPELARQLTAGCRQAMASWKGDLAKQTHSFQEWLGNALTNELERISESGDAHLEEFLMDAESRLHRIVRAFQDRLSKEIETALGIRFDGARFHAGISKPKRPDVRLGQIFDSHLELLWFAIPMGIFQPLMRRHFLKLLPWEAEKNLFRLANQWAEAVDASVGELAAQALEFMEKELVTIEALVSNAGDQRAEVVDALHELDTLG